MPDMPGVATALPAKEELLEILGVNAVAIAKFCACPGRKSERRVTMAREVPPRNQASSLAVA